MHDFFSFLNFTSETANSFLATSCNSRVVRFHRFRWHRAPNPSEFRTAARLFLFSKRSGEVFDVRNFERALGPRQAPGSPLDMRPLEPPSLLAPAAFISLARTPICGFAPREETRGGFLPHFSEIQIHFSGRGKTRHQASIIHHSGETISPGQLLPEACLCAWVVRPYSGWDNENMFEQG